MKNLIVILMFFIVGCSQAGHRIHDIKREHIVRVFMHEPGDYSVLVNNNGELVSKTFACKIRLIRDVPYDEPMYYEGERNRDGYFLRVEIHVHSEKDINGAGWNHGKFGSGQTVEVE